LCAKKVISSNRQHLRAQNIETRQLGASVQLKLSADGFNISISFQLRCNYSTIVSFFNFVVAPPVTRDPLSPVGKELQFTISLSFHSRCLSMRKDTFCQDFFLPSDKQTFPKLLDR
jgi:hypothetical protein